MDFNAPAVYHIDTLLCCLHGLCTAPETGLQRRMLNQSPWSTGEVRIESKRKRAASG